MKLVTLALCASLSAGGAYAQPTHDAVPLAELTTAPSVSIGNHTMSVKVYVPDAHHGFYRGTRFDWSGIIGSLSYGGHDFFVPWFQAVSPTVVDYATSDGMVVNSTNNATGPAEEFNADGGALGYEETPVGGAFLKIGVGLLRRADAAGYDKFRRYEVLDAGKRSIVSNSLKVSFTQSIGSISLHYAYSYTKTLRVDPKLPVMWIEHTFKNSGARPISTSVYNHNFLNIDGAGSTASIRLQTSFALRPGHALDAKLAEIRDNQLVILASPAMGQMIVTELSGYGTTDADNAFCIVDTERRLGVQIIGDRPLSHLLFWAIKPVTAVEPYITFTVAPGESVSWSYRYEFQTGAATCGSFNTPSASR